MSRRRKYKQPPLETIIYEYLDIISTNKITLNAYKPKLMTRFYESVETFNIERDLFSIIENSNLRKLKITNKLRLDILKRGDVYIIDSFIENVSSFFPWKNSESNEELNLCIEIIEDRLLEYISEKPFDNDYNIKQKDGNEIEDIKLDEIFKYLFESFYTYFSLEFYEIILNNRFPINYSLDIDFENFVAFDLNEDNKYLLEIISKIVETRDYLDELFILNPDILFDFYVNLLLPYLEEHQYIKELFKKFEIELSTENHGEIYIVYWMKYINYYLAMIEIQHQTNTDIIMKYLLKAGDIKDAKGLRTRLFQEKYLLSPMSTRSDNDINFDVDTMLYLFNLIKECNK